jgi:Pregnancy-associated plasma protein-A/Secretion system C-terminal sorting domain
LNIWVCNIRYLRGYATFPADYAKYPRFDGIVMNTGFFTATGRTLTHEMGHWLNLSHLWGNRNGSSTCETDFVDDTPAQKFSTQGCPSYPRLANCNPADPSVMFMNYMDYSDDLCLNLFTNGQKLRARAIFATGGPRAVQLNGFFGFSGTQAPIYCSGKVAVSGMCVPATWTLVSGPATISAGQGTNQITLQVTGNGVVTLRAAGGNYTSGDVSINVFAAGPLPQGINGPNHNLCYVGRGTSEKGLFSTPNPNSAFTYFWQIDATPAGSGTSILVDAFRWDVGTHQIRVRSYSASCGYSAWYTSTFIIESCSANRFALSPNPAVSSLTVSLSADISPAESVNYKINSVKITDQSGILKKNQNCNNSKTATVNIDNLSPGIYFIEIIDGDYRERKQFIVQPK